MTQRLPNNASGQDPGLDWARIAGFTMVITFHVAAVLLLLAPVNPPATDAEQDDVTQVVIIEPPPPPEPERPPEIKELAPPQPSPLPPPPDDPPVVFDTPSPMDTPAPPPAPPAPPAPPQSIEASIDISSRAMNPPRYPPAALRSGITGTVILVVSVDANGNVTDVSVERSSRNRDLDRAAIQAARNWRFNPAMVDGRASAGLVRVPVEFNLD